MKDSPSDLTTAVRMRSKRDIVIFALQLVLWWGANNWYAVDAHFLFRRYDAPLLFINLSFCQLVFGACAAYVLHLFNAADATSDTSSQSDSTSQTHSQDASRFRAILVAIGLCQCLGVLFTNASYSVLGSTSTLVWKLTEPLTAAVLKKLVLGTSTSFLSVGGIFVVVAGVMVFSVNSLTAITVSPVILSNLVYPLRNVLIKLDQKNDRNQTSSAKRYCTLMLSAIPFCLVALLYSLFSEGLMFASIPFVIRNAAIFNAYMFVSICLLEKLDPLTHALANTAKRFTGIVVSAIFVGDAFTMHHIIGVLLTIVGYPLYILGGNPNLTSRFRERGSRTGGRPFSLPLGIAIGFLMGIYFSTERHDAQRLLSLSTFTAKFPNSSNIGTVVKPSKRLDDPEQESPLSPPNDVPPKKKYVVRVDADRLRARPIRYRNASELLQHSLRNVGNFVWQHAAYHVLPDFSNTVTCNDTREVCEELHPFLREGGTIVSYRPVANIVSEEQTTVFLQAWRELKQYGDYHMYVGAGCQIGFLPGDMSQDMRPGLEIESKPKDITLSNINQKYVRGLEERKLPMFTRGDFTKEVLEGYGYKHGISLGCPSLMLNPDLQIGRTLQRKYEALRGRIGDRSLKVAINYKREPRFEKFLTAMLKLYPNSLLFAQGLNDLGPLKSGMFPFEKIRLFPNVEDWQESIAQMDVAFGPRIHGNMIALSVSVPVFVIAPDQRVLELVERMKIPHTTALDERLVDDLDIAQLISEHEFDGEAFDLNRCKTAKVYEDVFQRFDFDISSHVKAIAGTCDT